jgi:glutathione S-transferase
MPQLKLTYFDSPGRAEPVRVALRLAGAPFEDHRVNFAGFMELKQSGALPLGSVPVLEVDGFTMTQTAAMLRFAARLGETGLYPSDPAAAFMVDSALDTFNDTWSHALVPSLFERDKEKKLAMRAEFAAGPMKRVFDYVEAILTKSGGPFVAGKALSIADLVIAQSLLQIRTGGLDGITPDMLQTWPHLLALADAYLAEPRIAALSVG